MIIQVKQANAILSYDLIAQIVDDKGHERAWMFKNNEFQFRVIERGGKILKITDLPTGIEVSHLIDVEERIYEIFDAYQEQERQGVAPEGESEEKNYPYDPKKINISNYNWSVDTIRKMMDKGKISLSPDFQRNFVWDHARKSRLIESILLGIPVPAFYFALDSKGIYHVVDGLQRLTTIRQFFNNEFKLKYLEYLHKQDTDNLEGYYYRSDATEKKKGINDIGDYDFTLGATQFNVNVINATTPTAVKFDIFRRVNSGGKPLNNQEMRNCLMETTTRKLINELSESLVFKNATGYSIDTKRMTDQELIMRFIGFWYLRESNYSASMLSFGGKPLNYAGDMQHFLNELVDFLNQKGTIHHAAIKNAFQNAMLNAYHLFGKYSFRKCLPSHLEEGASKTVVNRALFTTWALLLSRYDAQKVIKHNLFESFAPILAHALSTDSNFFTNVTHQTNNKKSLDAVFVTVHDIIKNNLQL